MSLGAGETTLLRMVTAYSMLANGGKQVRATFIDRIQDRYGRTVWRHDTRDCSDCSAREWAGQTEPELIDDRKQIIDPMTAYQITSIMEGVVQRGTARRLKALGRPIAGKTGTTNDEKDAWFVGFTPDLVVGAYVGFDQPKPMGRGETGGHVAAPAFRDFITAALADTPPIPFRAPPGISLVRVNHKSGRPASPGDKTAIMEAFKPGSEPYGAVPIGPVEGGEISPAGDDIGQAPAQGAFPGAAPGQFPTPRRGASRPDPGGAFPTLGDRALTSGTGGLY
jgi:penicillin-binding protein 1A